MKNDLVTTLAQSICNCREFCGNENEAFREACDDLHIKPTIELRAQAFATAKGIWASYQRDAGVPEKYYR